MRKDFLVDPYQVLEARRAGAGGVLVILRMLPRAETDALHRDRRARTACSCCWRPSTRDDIALMHQLVETYAGGAQLLGGVNCRDLSTLEVVPARLLELAPLLPAQIPRVAESGVASAADARRGGRLRATRWRWSAARSCRAMIRRGLPRRLLAAGRAAVP